MARPQKEAYELTDAEKRDLIQLIQQGKKVIDIFGNDTMTLVPVNVG